MRDVREMAQILADKGDIEVKQDADCLPYNYQAIKFSCPTCGETYTSEKEARDCRDQRYDTGGLEVGDIVVVPSGYLNMIPEDDPWLAFIIPPDLNSDSHFDRTGYRVPYFVVTAIHPEYDNRHRCVVTLCSLAGGRPRSGWNPPPTGYITTPCSDGTATITVSIIRTGRKISKGRLTIANHVI